MKFVKFIIAYASVMPRDLAGLAGAGLIAYGASLMYRPLGYVAAGMFLLVGAWLMARSGE